MTDSEILAYLRWLYLERELCKWCRHPLKAVVQRKLCQHCYRLALDFRKQPTPGLANAIKAARAEGTINAVEWPIGGLEIEQLFERVADMAFSWRKRTNNPFWHSANKWGESFSNAQLRLLFHYFSIVEREWVRSRRRKLAEWRTMDMEITELRQLVKEAKKVVSEIFKAS